jgi:ribonuclease T1
VLILLAAGLLAILGAAGLAALVSSSPSAGPTPRTSTATPRSHLPGVGLADLPAQARQTLNLVDRGGPYPYPQDNTVFANQEGLLPSQPVGYYREYTVVTPGSADRGTRRLIVGADGDIYYTGDHYASFRQVLR